MRHADTTAERETWGWLVPTLLALCLGAYFVARYGGRWAEADTATFTRIVRGVLGEGRLVPSSGELYPNGFGYQSIAATLALLTGLDIATLQQRVAPLLAALVALPAWVLYRELTGSQRGALLGTLLLVTQPEFLFVILRGSHEKFTRVLVMLCLFLLVRSLVGPHRPGTLALYVGLFYGLLGAIVASNNLIANSLIGAVATALVLSAVLLWLRPGALPLPHHGVRRFGFIVVIGLMLLFAFTFYVYAPAERNLEIVRTLVERVTQLLFDPTARRTNAYAAVAGGWRSLPIYFAVSLANWVVLGLSALIWLRQGWRWFVRGAPVPSGRAWVCWALYAAFAAQGAVGVVIDASGSLGANLQLRLFPSLAMLAVALVASALAEWRPRRFPWVMGPVVACALCGFALLGALKATNEPLLSNKWTFYQEGELAALRWADGSLRDSAIWTEFDERLVTARVMTGEVSARGNTFQDGEPQTGTRVVLQTELSRLRGARLERPLPPATDAFRIYDNGFAQIYRVRPQTPYQR